MIASSELDDSEKARLLDGMPEDAENIGFGKTVYFTYIDEETGLEFCITKDEYATKNDFGVNALNKTIYGSNYRTTISGTPQKIRNTFTVSTDSDAVNKYDDSMAVGVYWGGEDSYYSTSYARAKFPNLSTGTTTNDHGKLEGRFLVQKNYYGQTFLGDWKGYIAESITSISWAFTVSSSGISVESGLFDDVTEWTAPLLDYTTAN